MPNRGLCFTAQTTTNKKLKGACFLRLAEKPLLYKIIFASNIKNIFYQPI